MEKAVVKKNNQNISFSLLGLSLFLLFTFTFSTHVFCFHNISTAISSASSSHKQATVSVDKNDLNTGSFIGEVEEVEENETEDHSLLYHLPIIFSFYTSNLHSQESSNVLLNNSNLKSSLYSTPVFIKNCTFLI
jgi:hypothetical protein